MPQATRIGAVKLDRLFVPRLWAAQAVQAGALVGIVWALASAAPWGWWLLALGAYFAMSCLGMAIGVHRAICHKAFTLVRPLEMAFSVMGALGMTGSPLGWVGTHRTHHAHSDHEGDPHDPHSHGWHLLVTGPDPEVEWWRMRDMLRDPFQRWLHRYYLAVALAYAAALAAIDPLAALFGFVIPAGVQVTVTNLSTILAHGHGYRNVETRDDSTNNPLIAALTWGEGWHNNHHASPRHWSMARKWWEIDIAGWVVRLLAATGGIRRDSFFQPLQPGG